MDRICMVYVTASNKDEALAIGKKIVSMRLAACSNIHDGVKSFYRWEGKEQEDEEAVLIMKTRESLLPELEKAVKEAHSYTCPCIVAVPTAYVSKEFEEWILSETE
ncbi:divalent-cation tolerance protein CutA [Candidatus Omnitrophota bacterium]